LINPFLSVGNENAPTGLNPVLSPFEFGIIVFALSVIPSLKCVNTHHLALLLSGKHTGAEQGEAILFPNKLCGFRGGAVNPRQFPDSLTRMGSPVNDDDARKRLMHQLHSPNPAERYAAQQYVKNNPTGIEALDKHADALRRQDQLKAEMAELRARRIPVNRIGPR
jgi:hypothetical protein